MVPSSRSMLLGVLLVLVAAQSAHARHLLQTCKYSHCPSGYLTVEGVPNVTMCPLCYKPAQIQCGTYAGKPLCCGGATGTICPSVACATSYSYSITGPGGAGCAFAQSTISAFSFTNSTYNFQSLYTPVFKDYCSNPTSDAIGAFVSNLVEAYSTAVATTLIQYNTYVCECVSPCFQTTCSNQTVAYTTVLADVQAIARAQASALQSAVTEVDASCFAGGGSDPSTVLSTAFALADAVASDVTAAIDELYQAVAANSTTNCKAQATLQQVKTTVAQAVACSYVSLFALARDSCTPDTAYACASSIALAGNFTAQGNFISCPINVQCQPSYSNVTGVADCATANTVLDANWASIPVPTDSPVDGLAPPAPGLPISSLLYKYDSDMENSTMTFAPSLTSVQSSTWCTTALNKLVYAMPSGQKGLKITFPPSTTAIAVAVKLNGAGKCTYSGVASKSLGTLGTTISDPSWVVNFASSTSDPQYVGITVESWVMTEFDITCDYDFIIGDIYISNVVVSSGIAVPIAFASTP